MATGLLRIGDEIVVQIETPEDLARPIAWGGAIPAGTAAIAKVAALLDELCRPFREFFDKAGDLIAEPVEVELGIGFEGTTGTAFIAAAKTQANLKVKVRLGKYRKEHNNGSREQDG